MSFATRLATALAEENPGFYTAVAADLEAFQSSLDAELVTFGAGARTRSWLDDQILALAIDLADKMHGRGGPAGGTPLTLETGYRLLLETGDNLLLEA